jgi:hypothetical protein
MTKLAKAQLPLANITNTDLPAITFGEVDEESLNNSVLEKVQNLQLDKSEPIKFDFNLYTQITIINKDMTVIIPANYNTGDDDGKVTIYVLTKEIIKPIEIEPFTNVYNYGQYNNKIIFFSRNGTSRKIFILNIETLEIESIIINNDYTNFLMIANNLIYDIALFNNPSTGKYGIFNFTDNTIKEISGTLTGTLITVSSIIYNDSLIAVLNNSHLLIFNNVYDTVSITEKENVVNDSNTNVQIFQYGNRVIIRKYFNTNNIFYSYDIDTDALSQISSLIAYYQYVYLMNNYLFLYRNNTEALLGFNYIDLSESFIVKNGQFPDGAFTGNILYNINRFPNKIIFYVNTTLSNFIYIFDFETKTFNKFTYEENTYAFSTDTQGYLINFPNTTAGNKVNYYYNNTNHFDTILMPASDVYVIIGFKTINETTYCILRGTTTNKVYVLNLITKEVKIINLLDVVTAQVGTHENSSYIILYSTDNPRNKTLIINILTGEYKEVVLPVKEVVVYSYIYNNIKVNNYYVAYESSKTDLFIIDLITGKYKDLTSSLNATINYIYSIYNGLFLLRDIVKNQLIIFDWFNNELLLKYNNTIISSIDVPTGSGSGGSGGSGGDYYTKEEIDAKFYNINEILEGI